MKYLLLLLCLLAGLTGCGEKKRVSEIMRLEGRMRILMHEPGRYTILAEMPNWEVKQYSFGRTCGLMVPVITYGLPAEQPVWVAYQVEQSGPHICNRLIEIHLHSVTEINGAGWDHGKQGKGQTTVVQ
jgi:hypothetical protein